MMVMMTDNTMNMMMMMMTDNTVMTMMMMVMMMTDNTVQNSSKAFHDIKETEIAHKRDDDENLDDGDAVNDETQVHYGH